MDKNALIKWALIAGAAYLVYRYLESAGYFGTSTATTTATPPEALPPSTATTTQALPAPAASLPPSISADQIAASLLAVPGFSYWGVNGEGGATTQTADHWNYYWKRTALYNGQDADWGEIGVGPDDQLTLAQYSNKVAHLFYGAALTGVDPVTLGRLMSAWA